MFSAFRFKHSFVNTLNLKFLRTNLRDSTVQFLSAALQCAKIDSGKNLLIVLICTMLASCK
ncbi:Uncharacterized protein APZ42_004847 [Daphnia magna]|uniref:Uncharacterized protein n=1 Tax=Daphnia magna TaxID=35525 RepID=A0A164GT55_9CRUS|nr:Uncharacterized protein APZ42_004847 [Daphnia magna]